RCLIDSRRDERLEHHEQFVESLCRRGDARTCRLRNVRASLHNGDHERQICRHYNSGVRDDDLLFAGCG
ncbi:MAG: hypothetical protein ABL996_20185, partial [Micropepsaceae bacterium]